VKVVGTASMIAHHVNTRRQMHCGVHALKRLSKVGRGSEFAYNNRFERQLGPRRPERQTHGMASGRKGSHNRGADESRGTCY
jgi:hypothetical protein